MVVEKLSKAAHFMALSDPYTGSDVAGCYMDHVFKLRGFPSTITGDRFHFYQSVLARFHVLTRGSGSTVIQLPSSDGQTEVVNRCLETYLRCMCNDAPHKWSKWLPLPEWWCNTSYHTATTATPYEIMYGQPTPINLPYLPGGSKVEVVDRNLIKREEMMKLIKFHSKRAKERMKQVADKRRSDRQFKTEDFVCVKLHP